MGASPLPPLLLALALLFGAVGCATLSCEDQARDARAAGDEAEAERVRARCQERLARMRESMTRADADSDRSGRTNAFGNRQRARRGLP